MTSPGDVKELLGTVFKQIREAQTLDANGDELGAYRHYLSSVALTAQALSADIQANQGQGTLPQQQVSKLYKMARDCLDRGEAIFSTANKEQRPLALFRLATPSPTTSPTLSNHPQAFPPPLSSALPPHHHHTVPSTSSSIPPSHHPHTSSVPPLHHPHHPHPVHTQREPSHTLPRKGFAGQTSPNSGFGSHSAGIPSRKNMSLPRTGAVAAVGGIHGGTRGATGGQSISSSPYQNVRHMSFVDEAKLRNRHMMEQYKSRHRTGKPVYNEAGLSMLRRLEENLSVARIREQTIAKRLKEKEVRAKEAGLRSKPAVTLSSLSVDELCDQVTSFEHGKANISAIKARLNGSDSDPSLVYAAVSEIMSITDHPLSRLLGENQYSVYMKLQPVGAAVEGAGGLPRLEIKLDNNNSINNSASSSTVGDKKSVTIEIKPRPYRSCDSSNNDVESLLELLCSDDEEEEEEEGEALHGIDIGAGTFDNKLELLKKELMRDQDQGSKVNEEEEERYEIGSSSQNGGRVYENTKQFDSNSQNGTRVYENTERFDSSSIGKRSADDKLANAPMFDTEDYHPLPTNATPSSAYTTLSATTSSVYATPSPMTATPSVYATPSPLHATPSSVYATPSPMTAMPSVYATPSPLHATPSSIYDVPPNRGSSDPSRSLLYGDLEDVSSHIRKQLGNGGGNGGGNGDGDAHIYESLDGDSDDEEVFISKGPKGTKEVDFPDGGVLSSSVAPSCHHDDVELEEMFGNLPLLVCTSYLGKEEAVKKLSDTADSVLKEVVREILTSLDKLLQCFSSCYPLLSHGDNQEVCRSVLEASFFPAILSPLTIIYRCKNFQEEVAIAKNMCQYVNATPRDLSVRKKYWLIEQNHAPYGEAIDELRNVISLRYPSNKLECLVRMSKQVIQCIETNSKKFRSESTQVDLVGVDDILPILSYVILRSGLPGLVSECSIMEDFIQEGYAMGEEGFCLTSFLTALKYVTHMSL